MRKVSCESGCMLGGWQRGFEEVTLKTEKVNWVFVMS